MAVFLFLLAIYWIMKENNKETAQWDTVELGEQLEEKVFADDISLVLSNN